MIFLKSIFYLRSSIKAIVFLVAILGSGISLHAQKAVCCAGQDALINTKPLSVAREKIDCEKYDCELGFHQSMAIVSAIRFYNKDFPSVKKYKALIWSYRDSKIINVIISPERGDKDYYLKSVTYVFAGANGKFIKKSYTRIR